MFKEEMWRMKLHFRFFATRICSHIKCENATGGKRQLYFFLKKKKDEVSQHNGK